MMLRLVRRAARRNQRCKHFPLLLRQNLLPVSFCHPNQMGQYSRDLQALERFASRLERLVRGRVEHGFGGSGAMALSVDLRERVLAAHERREGSQRVLA